MSEKLSDEQIAKVREMRMNRCPWALIRKEVGVSNFVIQKYCKDITVNLKQKNPDIETIRNPLPYTTLTFDELSEEDKKKYNSCKPAVKGEENQAYVTGTKGRYCNANVFEASRRGNIN